jgi:hypothetical protein
MGGPAAGFAAGAGTILNLEAQGKAKRERFRQANMEKFRLEQEAQEIERQTKREVDLFKKRGEIALGDQASSFAAAGVDISSSPLLVMANTKTDINREANEIKRQGEEQARLARIGARQVVANANAINRGKSLRETATFVKGISDIFRSVD